MKQNGKKQDQTAASGKETLENYYDLKIDAVEALANADTDEVPEYSKEELEKYRTQNPIRVPEVLKVCFIKWWFAGAVYYFCGFGLWLSHWLDMIIIYSIALGMVNDILTNNVLRYFERNPGDSDKWLMFPKKGLASFFLNILYAFPVVATVWGIYGLLGEIVNLIAGEESFVGGEPLSFGLFVLGADLLFVGMKNLILRLVKKNKR